MQRTFLILLLSPLLFLTSSRTQAAGIQVTPSRLNLHASPTAKTSAELLVINPTSDVQLYEVYPDDFADVLKATPSSFTLEAQGSKTISIAFQPGKAMTGTLYTNLSVVAKPLADSAFQANSGVKLPLTITITHLPPTSSPANSLYRYILYACLAAAILSFASVYILQKRKQRLTQVQDLFKQQEEPS